LKELHISPGREELAAIRRSVELVGRFTDGLLRIGPFRLGAEAALDWIPGVGEVYGSAAAIFLLVQGSRAKVPLKTLLGCAGLMFGRTLITAVPVAGPLAADAIALHGLSARLIMRAIDRRLAKMDGPARPARRAWLGRRPAAVAL
jgi:hypothetical protein